MVGEEFEAIGQVAEGALVGRAVEPDRGDPAAGDTPEMAKTRPNARLTSSVCANCQTPIDANFCPNCGQKAGLHRTLRAFWHDLAHGALHFDGKTWRTLPKLAFKPGELTRRYIEGERARFVSPMALFLFSIFLMFAVFQALGISAPTQITPMGGVDSGLAAAQEQIVDTQKDLQDRLGSGELTDTQIAATQKELDEARQSVADMERARTIVGDAANNGEMTMNVTGIDFIDEGIVKKWRENPSLMIYKLQANSYKFSWLLIPLSVPFVWLLFFWKRRFKAYDHAIFVTYSLAFMSLLFVLLSGLAFGGVATPIIAMSAVFIPAIHLYKHLRGTYGLGRIGTIVRLMILTLFITIIITLFLQLLLVLGAF